jgi:hypothetical protein
MTALLPVAYLPLIMIGINESSLDFLKKLVLIGFDADNIAAVIIQL